jgi:hypothetical protein
MLYRLSYASTSGDRCASAQTNPTDPAQMSGTINKVTIAVIRVQGKQVQANGTERDRDQNRPFSRFPRPETPPTALESQGAIISLPTRISCESDARSPSLWRS